MAAQRDELPTVPQVLAELGDVSPRTFYRCRETGKAPSVVNRRWTDTASAHDERGLKHRSVSETRRGDKNHPRPHN